MNRIDDQARVLISKKLRDRLGWVKGDTLELIPNVNGKFLSVKVANNNSKNHHEIDFLGRLQIPKTIRELLGWECTNTLEHIVDENNKCITMRKVA